MLRFMSRMQSLGKTILKWEGINSETAATMEYFTRMSESVEE